MVQEGTDTFTAGDEEIEAKGGQVVVVPADVGTVKTHLNNLYRKLGAHSRTQAVARARELKLL